mmetsp:Transcript_53066/g.158154  ORF Transcript_53066/g.158154 Transcript_53066/m.158154 type:complete len:261 (-) Transcript_53066:54-836(-)
MPSLLMTSLDACALAARRAGRARTAAWRADPRRAAPASQGLVVGLEALHSCCLIVAWVREAAMAGETPTSGQGAVTRRDAPGTMEEDHPSFGRGICFSCCVRAERRGGRTQCCPRAMLSAPASWRSFCQHTWSCAIRRRAVLMSWIVKSRVASFLPLLRLKSSIHWRHSLMRPGARRLTSWIDRASASGSRTLTFTARIFQSASPSSMRHTAPRGRQRTTWPTPATPEARSRTSKGSLSPGAPQSSSLCSGSRNVCGKQP